MNVRWFWVCTAFLLATHGCKSATQLKGTSLFVTVNFDEAMGISQLKVDVVGNKGAIAPAHLLPDAPKPGLTSGQTVRLLLSNALAGTTVTVRVEGIDAATSLALGEASAVVRLGYEVDVAVQLSKLGECGPTRPCGAGQTCVDTLCVCNAASCPSGCCQGTQCLDRSLAACAAAGAACQSCDSVSANRCSATGTCSCGDGPACSGGQRCVGGLCVCDSTSCPAGCCQGTSCQTRGLSNCGINGASCVGCDSSVADNCGADGTCRCGATPTCGQGQTCTQGTCTGGSCNGSNCPAGCCVNGACQARTLSSCGAGGSSCTTCEPTRADACTVTGVCVCGNGPGCAVGQGCDAGTCGCDATSCPTGCCEGNLCRTASLTTCGAQGGACRACDSLKADTCDATGACRCGTGAPCQDGQRCASGLCQCDAAGCPSGCCGSSGCTIPSFTACGMAGNACQMCNATLADNCTNGACTCGTGAACVTGQRCVLGSCVCDATSCPTGCCDAQKLCAPGDQKPKCGGGGNLCVACMQSKKCDAVTRMCM